MHENIQHRITELKEIALQIMNILDTKDTLWSSYAYTYLEAITNDAVQTRARQYNMGWPQAYESQLLYCLDNLAQWREDDARSYKALLKEYLAYFRGKQNTGKLNENVTPLWGMITGIGD